MGWRLPGPAKRRFGPLKTQPGVGPMFLVGVDNAGRNDNGLLVRLADRRFDAMAAGRRIGTGVPEIQAKLARPEESKIVGLIHMFVRTAGDAGQRLADVGHHRMLLGRKLILTVQLDEPPATVRVRRQQPERHAINGSVLKHQCVLRGLLRHCFAPFSWGDSCTVASGWQYNCHPNILLFHSISLGDFWCGSKLLATTLAVLLRY